MIIKDISIKKFRGFNNVDFELGFNLTAITGQNGTQKTTILGMLCQSFSITENENPMKNEKPLCGGTYISSFADKFKLSEEFDKVGEHEWTLNFCNPKIESYTIESIHREKSKGTIRFWKKGDKTKGSGYIQLPVIYLSLKRLIPIAEVNGLTENEDFVLTDDEIKFYKEHFNKILILTREADKIKSSKYLYSTNKQTLGASTDHYDWKSNSAGQDNLSKILLAILSFKRLKEKYGKDYNGGILAIDEIDATFYPGSQIKLIEYLIKFSSKFDIQIIFTTHSLTILENLSKLQEDKIRKDQIKTMFLLKEDGNVIIKNNVDYNFIQNHLNRSLTGKPINKKIDVYTEDKEGTIFIKSLLGNSKTKYLNFIDIPLGCGSLIQLAQKKIPSFTFPNSMIVLDGDVKKDKAQYNKVKKLKNILLLPLNQSPEQILAEYLNTLSDANELWGNIDSTYDHSICFEKYSIDEIFHGNGNLKAREVAKKWFNDNLVLWGRNANKVLNQWKKENIDEVKKFNHNFDTLLFEFNKKLRN